MAALFLAAGNSWALGLGQIQVKSKRNQPLVAEIPIISNTPGELAALQARLASPDTFRRVGLSPPSGAAANLQFSLGNDERGRPVIRVTTLKPVDQGALNFLIEVDWGKGRLVREYSALVDAPNTAGAGVQPTVQLPQAPADNLVQRSQPALPATAPVPPVAEVAVTAVPVPAAAPQPSAVPVAEPVPAPPAASMAEPLPAAPAAAPPETSAAAQYGPIKQGETLSKIAVATGLRSAFSLDQSMLALLRANPEAFLGDDINRLRRGAILRIPGHDDVAKIDASEATQVVRQQMQQWQQSRHAVRQPEAMPVTATASPKAAIAQAAEAAPKRAEQPVATPAQSRKPAVTAANKPAAVSAATETKLRRREEARLQIVPPTAPGKATGMKSGTQAGGKGSMLQQELRQRDEDIAAKTVEIGELKERVAALEKLKGEQQTLIAMKDTELAAAQARLAEANQAVAKAQTPAQPAPQVAATAASAAKTTQPAPAAEAPKNQAMPYVWGGVGFAALALLAWLLAGRRKPAPPVRRSVFDSEAMAASMVVPATAPGERAQAVDDAVEDVVESAAAAGEPPTAPANTSSTTSRNEMPAWHSGWVKTGAPAPAAPEAPASAPAATAPRGPTTAAAPAPAQDAPAQASIEQRFKLVDAFLDMGDKTSAQQILAEILNDDDDEASAKAGRMLTKLMG